MKLGLLIAQFNEIEFIKDCLAPWISFRLKNPNKLTISCLDVKFLENAVGKEVSSDGSLEFLQSCYKINDIDNLQIIPTGLKEHEARNYGLKYLLSQDIDYLLTWGSDEVIGYNQIGSIYDFVAKDPFTAFFKIRYKNFVGDKNHYVLGFEPPRIFKVKLNGNVKLNEFFWDDDITYVDTTNGSIRSYKDFPSKTIPKILVNHYTWLNGPRSVAKIEYQRKHFGHCSYKYNDKQEISFDPSYYKKFNQEIPEILSC